MPTVTKSTSRSAFTDARQHARAVARASALALAVMLTPATVRAQTDETRACIDAATRGQKLRDAGKLRAARDAFLACAATACPSLVRQDCSSWVAEVVAETPSVVLGARDASGRDLTRVRAFANDALLASALDGRTYPLDPGAYRFRFEREGGPSAFVDVVLRTSESARHVVVTFPPTPGEATAAAVPTSGPRPLAGPTSARAVAITALGGGALVGAVGVVIFGLRARGDVSDLRASCSPACNDDQERALHTDIFLANLSLGVGIASLTALVAVAVWPRATTRTATGTRASMTLTPAPAGMGGSLRVSF